MNAALMSGARPRACSSASGRDPVGHAHSASYSGATKLARPPLRTSPSTMLACELRWTST